jgi:1-acyl-sn-glycerol-3-phosphate acyltransferase
VQAGVPVVPVVVQNYSHVLHVQDRTFEPGVIKVKVCVDKEDRMVGVELMRV